MLNRIKAKLQDGEVAFGANTSAHSKAVIETLGQTSLDFVWFDLEHAGPSPFSSGTIADFARTAEVSGVELLVRVPEGRPKVLSKVLDTGINTVLVPQVRSATDVRQAVASARFEFDGDRGERGAPLSRATDWGPAPQSFPSRADSEVLVGVMIETVEAVENIQNIVSVPNLGFLFLGFSDLSIAAGHPLDRQHPEVQDMADTVLEAAVNRGIPIGKITPTADAATAAIESGYSIIQIGFDLQFIRESVNTRMADIDRQG